VGGVGEKRDERVDVLRVERGLELANDAHYGHAEVRDKAVFFLRQDGGTAAAPRTLQGCCHPRPDPGGGL
jgi:hypothetical protein